MAKPRFSLEISFNAARLKEAKLLVIALCGLFLLGTIVYLPWEYYTADGTLEHTQERTILVNTTVRETAPVAVDYTTYQHPERHHNMHATLYGYPFYEDRTYYVLDDTGTRLRVTSLTRAQEELFQASTQDELYQLRGKFKHREIGLLLNVVTMDLVENRTETTTRIATHEETIEETVSFSAREKTIIGRSMKWVRTHWLHDPLYD